MKETAYQMLYLTSCALHGQVPDKDKIAQIDLTKLYQMCQFHSLTSMVCMALESAGVSEPEWQEAKSKAIRKNIMLDVEREKICNFLEENGIWHISLKGVVLKEMYPQIGMRQMADNDILYDKAYQDEVLDFMLKNGYKTENEEITYHDTYIKPPVLNFEMHTALYSESSDKRISAYYTDVKNRLVKDENKKYSYHFTDEDFYIFMTVHEYKHYNSRGTGLRSLLDTYVYINQKNNVLDWNYISGELEKLGIGDFERKSRQLSMKVFSSAELPELSEDERKMLDFYLFSGTYGTMEQFVQRRIEKFQKQTGKNSKLGYIWYRIFPPMEIYEAYFPFFYRHKILLPVGWAYRLIRGVTARRKKVQGEIKYLYHSDDKI